jgi:hypothetical protein
MHSTRQQVMTLLRWDESQFAEFQYKTGKQYLQSYISSDPEGIDMLVGSRIFWNWWKNQWLARDMSFLTGNIHKLNHATALNIYLCLHNPDALIHSIYPGGAVLEDSYAQMIRNLIKSEI